ADYALWDDGGWRLTVRQVQLARDVGALDQLPFLLNRMAMDTVWNGDFPAATSLIAEADAVREATGSCLAPYPAMMLASFRGRQTEAAPLIQATIEEATAGGQGAAVTWAHWVAAVLCNGLGHYDQALAAARQASQHRHPHISVWALPELIEAATRTGSTHMTGDALDLLAETTQAGGSDLGLGIEARARALLSEGQAAERHYREAIGRLSRTRHRPELARAHLLYGEWLRRQRRRGEAREQLRTAHGMLDAIGMEAFAARARRELRATGENAPKHTVATMVELTAQEAQIARLAREGSRIRRSPPGCFCPRARSSTTWARSSPSSASARAASCAASCRPARTPSRCANPAATSHPHWPLQRIRPRPGQHNDDVAEPLATNRTHTTRSMRQPAATTAKLSRRVS
ncbi:MAG TPA: hypothetical protein VGO16_09150, partial [Pseudonocardiaceae bacterium]|nr:hypothetical protein [Pseudonocardiaceae bacterium]